MKLLTWQLVPLQTLLLLLSNIIRVVSFLFFIWLQIVVTNCWFQVRCCCFFILMLKLKFTIFIHHSGYKPSDYVIMCIACSTCIVEINWWFDIINRLERVLITIFKRKTKKKENVQTIKFKDGNFCSTTLGGNLFDCLQSLYPNSWYKYRREWFHGSRFHAFGWI